jgi:DNA/RNA endonuclease YhcR with UshA esterase domain
MKKTVLIALAVLGCSVFSGLFLASFHLQRAEAVISPSNTIAASAAASHIGQSITIEGIVSEVHVADRATFIDIGGRYPDEEFTGVIFPESYSAFPDVAELEGKTVDISGTVQLYRGKPEIILRSADQVRGK